MPTVALYTNDEAVARIFAMRTGRGLKHSRALASGPVALVPLYGDMATYDEPRVKQYNSAMTCIQHNYKTQYESKTNKLQLIIQKKNSEGLHILVHTVYIPPEIGTCNVSERT